MFILHPSDARTNIVEQSYSSQLFPNHLRHLQRPQNVTCTVVFITALTYLLINVLNFVTFNTLFVRPYKFEFYLHSTIQNLIL
jgi:hypothetical protein